MVFAGMVLMTLLVPSLARILMPIFSRIVTTVLTFGIFFCEHHDKQNQANSKTGQNDGEELHGGKHNAKKSGAGGKGHLFRHLQGPVTGCVLHKVKGKNRFF